MTDAPLISSQRYLDRGKVAHKAATFRVFRVRIHECELRGRRYRMIVDGHHNLAAARLAGVEPTFKPAGGKYARHLNRLGPAEQQAFLINNLTDSDHYFVETGEVVKELLPLEPTL
ncbi:chromosome partitioning protein ParB [Salinicola sp. LHM]|uniref:chromosome partitioning protein ParB n=1 Tax=Salinicola sp. LHM TaxID=3065298 RepID=UPI002ACDE1C3|nr:chromosome partitioning protein ParB [Salinicola sp. LHM]WQH34008.1 chromosome partitioning protein ParB [Salinicola sp. LHM]